MIGVSASKAYSPTEWLCGYGPLIWRRVYPGRLDLVGQARSWVALQLADTDCVDAAVSITAELVSNALLHTRSGQSGGWFGVEVSRGSHVRIAVRDLGGCMVPRIGRSAPASVDEPAEHGYGLLLVADLGAEMGVDGNPDEGHTVWVLLPVGPPPEPRAS